MASEMDNRFTNGINNVKKATKLSGVQIYPTIMLSMIGNTMKAVVVSKTIFQRYQDHANGT